MTKSRKYYIRLPLGSKVAYGLGDMANSFTWSFMSAYLMIFYTDVFGISAWAVTALFLVSRLWDAASDPLIGALSDRTRTGLGRYRPWILGGAMPLACCAVLVFWAHPHWSPPAKVIYAAVTYGLAVLAYTAVNIPYTALASAMTQDPAQRGALASFRMTLAIAGALFTAQMGARMVPFLAGPQEDLVKGYLHTAIILALLSLPLYGITVSKTREAVGVREKLPKGYLRQQLRASMKNRPLLLAITAHFLVGMTIYGRMAVVTYYFKYNVGMSEMAANFFLCMQGPMLAGSFCSQYVANFFRHKGKAVTYGFLVYGTVTVLNVFVTPLDSGGLFWIMLVFANFFHGIGYSMIYAIIPDTVEYNELLTGVRNDGVAASLTSFWNKVGMAIGTSATAGALGALNYVPNGVQPQATLTSINLITFLIPGAAALLVALLFRGYRLDYAAFNEIIDQLQTASYKGFRL